MDGFYNVGFVKALWIHTLMVLQVVVVPVVHRTYSCIGGSIVQDLEEFHVVSLFAYI